MAKIIYTIGFVVEFSSEYKEHYAFLEQSGHKVSVFESIEDTSYLNDSKNIDLWLIDSGIIQNDIEYLYKSIKKIDFNAGFILMKKKEDLDLNLNELLIGFCGVLTEPFKPEDLCRQVEEVLSMSFLRAENTRLKTLLPIYDLGEKIQWAKDETTIYNELISVIETVIKVPHISVMMFDEELGLLKIVACKGIEVELINKIKVKPGDKVSGWVFDKGEPIILNRDSQLDSPVASHLQRKDIFSAISFPLKTKSKIVGVLNICQKEKTVAFSSSDIELLTIICRQAMAGLENVRAVELREKNLKLKTLFQQYVSSEVADLLINQGSNLMDIGKVDCLTVMFADIRNFTLLVQQVPPKKLREFLNVFFDTFATIVYKHKGTLDKFMGDAALVIFGAPIDLDNPSEIALVTAGEILEAFEKLIIVWQKKYACFNEIGLGFGISRGEMFLGNVGSSKRFDYTVIGTAVNISQRLAARAKSGQILFTEEVQAELADTISYKREALQKLKGLQKNVEVFSFER